MNNRRGRVLVAAASLTLAVFAPPLIPVRAQAPPVGFPDLVGALKATPGCLGVETALTSSGKQVIFAWFEDKKALLGWYYSEAHQKAMRTFSPNRSSGRQPLGHIADDSGPILAVVSVTFVNTPRLKATSLPVSQIGIELYGPLPGGVAVGGRFAPEALKVRGLREFEMGTAQSHDR